MSILGSRLKELREGRGLRQEDIADIFSYGKSTISQWESGKNAPEYKIVTKLADYFNVSTDYLLGRTDEKHPFSVAEPPDKYHVELKWDPNDPIEKSTNEIAQMLEQAVRLEEMTEEEALKVLELAKEHIKIAKK